MAAPPLLQLREVRRDFPAGDGVISVLRGIDLEVQRGEMVAIVGASGSGKSTLMNILGCLDRPTAGAYRVGGRDTGAMTPDELAELRRDNFGFVFQRYNLLPDLTALSNVAVPALYAGRSAATRQARALLLLQRLGLGDRTHHRPGQLSGGQQQRVSIARALMNGGAVILADEPTGALDRSSAEEVMRILRELNADGHTIILVTHDRSLAAHASRVIEIREGLVVADRAKRGHGPTVTSPAQGPRAPLAIPLRARADRFGEAIRMAWLAMANHRLRAFLTMLGIIVGVASVVSVVALGRGAEERVAAQLSELGASTMEIYPGRDFGDPRAATILTLRETDAEALSRQPYVDGASPSVAAGVSVRREGVVVNALVNGIGENHFRLRGLRLAQGRLFRGPDLAADAQSAVLDPKALSALFPRGDDPIGATILVGVMPARVVGVLRPSQASGNGATPTIYVPYSSAVSRMLGRHRLESITVRVVQGVSSRAAQQAVTAFLTQRHGSKDFFIFNSDQIRQAITKANATVAYLMSSIAVIALIVGGIGVMNIMLVSVSERIREIGVRMAVGARRSDILRQFLIEAVLVCLLGGGVGVTVSLTFGVALTAIVDGFRMSFSPWSILVAFACSTGTGVLAGFIPARNAARLNPVEALVGD